MNSEDSARKYSKISTALRCKLLRTIYCDRMSIKQAATLCKLNYSTAKAIVREISEYQQEFIARQLKKLNQQPQIHQRNKMCSVVEVAKRRHREMDMKNNSSETEAPTITIISTIGWDFFGQQDLKNLKIQQ